MGLEVRGFRIVRRFGMILSRVAPVGKFQGLGFTSFGPGFKTCAARNPQSQIQIPETMTLHPKPAHSNVDSVSSPLRMSILPTEQVRAAMQTLVVMVQILKVVLTTMITIMIIVFMALTTGRKANFCSTHG